MGLLSLDRFKLEKLKISVYGNRLRVGLPQDSFTVMFNPESYSMQHENVFQKHQGINTSGRVARYSHSKSDELKLDLLFDGSGVSELGALKTLALLRGKSQSVTKRVDHFLDLCFQMDGEIHAPKYLKIQWGEGRLKEFDCRLKSVDITYKAFARNGAPLRATLKTVFVEDLEPKKRLKQDDKHSPDLSRSRTVKSGDTLPLLCKEIYGTSKHYLRIAEINQLSHFRDLRPGEKLVFPPLGRG